MKVSPVRYLATVHCHYQGGGFNIMDGELFCVAPRQLLTRSILGLINEFYPGQARGQSGRG